MGAGEEGECGTYGDTNMETYMTMCKIANGNLLLWFRELKQGLCNNLEGETGREIRGGLGGRGHGCTYSCFLLVYDKKHKIL